MNGSFNKMIESQFLSTPQSMFCGRSLKVKVKAKVKVRVKTAHAELL